MKIKVVIGINANKLKLDCCGHKSGTYGIFDNTIETIEGMIDWSLQTTGDF